jgi:hypothetical protein
MAPPSPRHDAAAGVGITIWVLGMGIVLSTGELLWQITGAVMWAVGVLAAGGVATHAYVTRVREPD